jgi:hypothetical protein
LLLLLLVGLLRGRGLLLLLLLRRLGVVVVLLRRLRVVGVLLRRRQLLDVVVVVPVLLGNPGWRVRGGLRDRREMRLASRRGCLLLLRRLRRLRNLSGRGSLAGRRRRRGLVGHGGRDIEDGVDDSGDGLDLGAKLVLDAV